MATVEAEKSATGAAGLVLITLCSAQFLMALDSSVMNVSIAQVAQDVGTTVTGVQTAITLYTLVMATLMITGGKIGTNIGRRRAFSIGCAIYALGSLTTALAPTLTWLIIGWSLLEGIGAALIMPAVVALVATNVPASGRAKAYGLVASAAAIAVAVGPILGGLVTTYASWRWVFVGEVVVAVVILTLARRMVDAKPAQTTRLDFVGTILSILGLGMAVLGILKSSEWGWIRPNVGAASLFGVSATFWLIVAGLLVVWLFLMWESRLQKRGGDPLLKPTILRNSQLAGGLTLFFFQFLLQSGVFFIVPLFLSVVLEMDALQTGLRLLPLSIALLVAAAGIPRFWPRASPRRFVRIGILMLLAGILVLMAGVDLDAPASVVAIPMLLVGLGIGSLASQLGAVTVSSVPDSESGEVGGLQNTASNLGASVGTALAGSVLIAALSASFLSGIEQNPAVPDSVTSQASVQLASGVPFISDTTLQENLAKAGASPEVSNAVVDANRTARIEGLDSALAVLALISLIPLFFTRRIPTSQPGSSAAA